MRTLVIHIGSHCTGSEAIQSWLHQNKGELSEVGITCIYDANRKNLCDFTTWRNKSALFPRGLQLGGPKSLDAVLRNARCRMAVISSDCFSYFFESAAIEEIADIALKNFDEVSVVCYLRRQDLHAVTHHAHGAIPNRVVERQLWGLSHGALPEVNEHQVLYLDYNTRLGLWEKYFGKSSMLPRACQGSISDQQGILIDFIDLLKVDRSKFHIPSPECNSVGRLKVRFGRLLNHWIEDSELAQSVYEVLPDIGAPRMPTRNAARRFLSRYRDGNRALNDRLGVSPHPDLFNDDMSDLPIVQQSDWTDQEFNAAMTTLIGWCVTQAGICDRSFREDLDSAATILLHREPDIASRLLRYSVLSFTQN